MIPKPSMPALAALVIYTVLSLCIGEAFPFSRYRMYARLGGYERSAVLEFRADGEPVEIEELERFSGEGLRQVGPPTGVHFSMGWRVHEANQWLATHRAAPGEEPGPVRFDVGYRVVRIGDGGPEIVEDFEPLASGRAWWR